MILRNPLLLVVMPVCCRLGDISTATWSLAIESNDFLPLGTGMAHDRSFTLKVKIEKRIYGRGKKLDLRQLADSTDLTKSELRFS